MSRPYESLAVAAASHSRSHEDRLTEIYATVLEEHSGFASEIAAHAGLSPSVSYEVYTQEVRRSGRVDLILKGLDRRGATQTVLYAEHKEPAGHWQPGQPKKYLRDLADETPKGAERRLVAVVDSAADARGHVRHRADGSRSAVERAAMLQASKREPRLVYMTWQAIAGCAELAGRKAFAAEHPQEEPLGWRERAATPTAPARQRLLLELIWYLEQEGYAVTTPLTKEQVAIYQQAVELDETLRQLLKTASDFLTAHDAKAIARCRLFRHSSAGAGIHEQRFGTSRNTWLDGWGGELWLVADADGGKGRTRGGALRFWAEVWLTAKNRDQQLLRRQKFMDAIEDRGLRFDRGDDGAVSINASMPVTPLLKLKTIEQQARCISEWAAGAFEQLLTLAPGRAPAG